MRQYDNALHMMEVLGGSFVKALADLYYMADSNNKSRVRTAFPEYFERYERMYQEHKQARATINNTDSEKSA